MKTIAQKYWKYALFTVVGAGLGFAYYRFVGCTSGTCPLTSSWHTSTLFGGLIGILAVPARKGKPDGITKTNGIAGTNDSAETNNNTKTD